MATDMPVGVKIPTPKEAFAARPQTKLAPPHWPTDLTTPAMLVIAAAQCHGPEFAGKLIDAVWEEMGKWENGHERAVDLCDIAGCESDWWWRGDPDLNDLMDYALKEWAVIGAVITPCSMFTSSKD